MSEFTLRIVLGNDAMRTPQDVAKALTEIANRLKRNDPEEERDGGRVYDKNGNSVGTWSYTAPEGE